MLAMMAEMTQHNSSIDDNAIALEGVTMLLNNDWENAKALFDQYKDYSALMLAGSSFVNFMQALMTFEDEKLSEAMKILQATEKRCESGNGFTKIQKTSGKRKQKTAEEREDKYQRQIVVADCIIHQAVLTFINQDIPSYIKGGWLLRKSYKLYDKLYRDLKKLHDKLPQTDVAVQNGTTGSPLSSNTTPEIDTENDSDFVDGATEAIEIDDVTNDLSNAPNNLSNSKHKNSPLSSSASAASLTSTSSDSSEFGGADMSPEVVKRLFASASFGYGTFQLCLSLIPPKILKIIEFLGFEGDRDVAMSCLHVTSASKDMKAPLASLALIWYHTVIRPFFALDGTNVAAGVEDAYILITECEKKYPKSGLFLFLKGRAQRLTRDLTDSLATYNTALESSKGQREIELICYHEIGWLNMMMLNYQAALESMSKLKEESRWSKSFYCYLSGLCMGALGDIKGAAAAFKEVPGLVRKKNNQIEGFVLRRSERYKKSAPTLEICQLMILEVVYLWNAITQVPKEYVDKMIEVCNNQTDKKVFHIRSLIEGALYRELGENEYSLQLFEEAVARQQGMKEDKYVPAYAMYEQGMYLAQDPHTFAKGKKLLTQSKENYKDFEFDNRLHVRVNNTLKRIKTEGTPL